MVQGPLRLPQAVVSAHPVKRVEIEKSDGGVRKLGIPTVLDRVVQQALVQRMEPIFEPLFSDCSFGYRPGRSPHDAMRRVWQDLQAGYSWIVDADLRSYFDNIDRCRLREVLRRRVNDGRIMRLIGKGV